MIPFDSKKVLEIDEELVMKYTYLLVDAIKDKMDSEKDLESELVASSSALKPDFDKHIKGFQQTWHERKLREEEERIKKANGGELPPDYKRDPNKRYVFDYGEYVAEKVKVAKTKKGEDFDNSDFYRVAKLVNEAVAKHQQEYYSSLEKQKAQEKQAKAANQQLDFNNMQK